MPKSTPFTHTNNLTPSEHLNLQYTVLEFKITREVVRVRRCSMRPQAEPKQDFHACFQGHGIDCVMKIDAGNSKLVILFLERGQEGELVTV